MLICRYGDCPSIERGHSVEVDDDGPQITCHLCREYMGLPIVPSLDMDKANWVLMNLEDYKLSELVTEKEREYLEMLRAKMRWVDNSIVHALVYAAGIHFLRDSLSTESVSRTVYAGFDSLRRRCPSVGKGEHMKIKIRRKTLVEHRACKEGLEWFDALKERMGVPKNKVLTIQWDALAMVWSLTDEDSRRLVRWAINKGILPSWSLSDADLRGAYLFRADLSDADLRGADLRGADLSDADLRDADLRGADLSDADLSDADLRGAYLFRADLSDADLRGADLRGADLSDADLRGAYYPTGYVPAGWRRTETGHLTSA